jgi:predicted Zn-dependent protease
LSSASEPVGTIDVALAHAARLAEANPALAVEQAGEILKAVPGHPHGRLILAQAQRRLGNTHLALEILEPLAREQPRAAAVHLELGLARAEVGRLEEASEALQLATRLKPDLAEAWRALGDTLDAAGDATAADQARARSIKAATRDPRLLEAAAALVENKLPIAESRLRTHLLQHPTDVAALRMLAEVAARLRRYADAERLLRHCVDLSPSFQSARYNLAIVLHRQSKSAEALGHLERLLAAEARNPAYRNLQAAILATLGDYAESIGVYEAVLKDYPRQPKVWMSYGHALKTSRRQPESIVAYRRSIDMEPTLGEAYWSLANLKTFRFAANDVAAMRAQLARTDLADDDRLHFEFALAKALEDAESWEDSFTHYAVGNEVRRKQLRYRARDNDDFVRRSKELFTKEFFAARAGAGAVAADPIFILGMPRAGSTLLEQILSSHSLVEGTMELPDIPAMARELERDDTHDGVPHFAQRVADLTGAELRALGERYIESTRVQRKTAAPYFIDKMPNNWFFVGLIHLILPNAKIIDARRHPVGCCFSNFKQHFARGQAFTYSLEDIGRYYRGYVELMAHFDAVLPGSVHRMIYERTIDDTEAEVRGLLEHCGLPFEGACLRFYENERAVRTASSEQVRQPIFREGVDHWRHYEPWLGPLKDALGPVLECYPAVPAFPGPVDDKVQP